MTIAEFHNVEKRYGKTHALENVSLNFISGQVTVLLGHNGSGKSTMLKMLASLMLPDNGSVSVFNGLNEKTPKLFRKRIGFLFDHNGHFEHLTGYQNAWFFLSSYGMKKKDATAARLDELFSWIGLSDKKDDLVATYSYGMRRKLALLEAVAHKPDLLLLDEPTMGLDYTSRLEFYRLIGDLSQQGVSTVISTNDIYEATIIGQQIVILKNGKLIANGTPDKLLSEVKKDSKIIVTLMNPISLIYFEKLLDISHIETSENKEGFVLEIMVKPQRNPLPEIIFQIVHNRGMIKKIQMEEPNLADVYLKNN
ncbi:ABC transporter ATP-binding protein [uncultured Sphaerochaeta sp.]|uniref:ABC transporter ATP-binding protein n=1 Tax=uncultured Sphaerochaeta sp. TaxID=886478 RepID=UPI002A0A3175|nr:ABC transporter ATP-binding protein [uncultured Sphaerochaeta sp.]